MSQSEPQPECPNCQRLERRVRELEAQVEHLTGLVNRLTKALEASQRAGKRQAASFSKGQQAGPPKPPRRKPGDEHGVHRHRAVPEQIDEVHAAPPPDACPECGGRAFSAPVGITLARATTCRSVLKTAEQCRPAYEQIRQPVRGSPWVVPDETGWRVDGRSAWLHAFVGASATCYAIAPGRGHEPLTEVIGEDYSGDLIHDGWVVYDRFRQAGQSRYARHFLSREFPDHSAGPARRLERRIPQAPRLEVADHADGRPAGG